MKAGEIMQKRVITVPPEMTLKELAKLFIERRVTGAPVVAADGKLVGVVSQTDLVRRDRETPVEVEVPGFYADGEKVVFSSGLKVEEPDYTRVRDVMTPAVFCAEESTPVPELAKFMLRKRIHRVVITAAGKMRGIVTTMDMLRAFLAPPGRSPTRRR